MNNVMTTIPLSQLRPSKANMRKTNRRSGIKELAASIAAHGLLENLVVHPKPNGTEPPSYEVVAGGRRLEALNRLAKAGSIEPDHPVSCLVKQEGIDGAELSLAENFERIPPHPADQFDAFAKLARNATPEAIASRFGISAGFVRQRLKLAKVSRRLIAQYRADAMTLEQLMAFTISDDHALQEQVWFTCPNADIDPSYFRRQLTQSQVLASERRARFVGVKAYEAAGGIILRDLFDTAQDGYFNDSLLLDRLVADKLAIAAQTVRTEGWSWVETLPEADYRRLADFGRVAPSEIDLCPEEEQKLSTLAARYNELVASVEENGEGEEELNDVEAELNGMRLRKETWSEADKVQAGAIVSLDYDGTLSVTRGLLQPQPAEEPAAADQSAPQETRNAGYAESVLVDLSAHRTAALRACVANNPDVAFLVLLYALVAGSFHGHRSACIEITATETNLERASRTVGESKASHALLKHAEYWKPRVPDLDGLWPWLQSLDSNERHALMAFCVGQSLNALMDQRDARRKESGVIAGLVGLDMRHWWKPSPAFLGQLTKAQIVSALGEVISLQSAQGLSDLRKPELAERAVGLLAERDWLPEAFRQSV